MPSGRCPRWAIAASRFSAVVVLPTPPFWLNTAITVMSFGAFARTPADMRRSRLYVGPLARTEPRANAGVMPYHESLMARHGFRVSRCRPDQIVSWLRLRSSDLGKRGECYAHGVS